MNEHDEQLNERLRAWRGIEPGAGFEAEVWRRVAVAPATGLEWFEALRQWFGVSPALASAAALLLAVAIGIGSTLALAQPRSDMLTISTPTLNGQTLASTYLALASGAAR
jgi:hypothetical protein